MPSYEWKGRDRSGVAQTGVLIGDSKDAVIAALRRQQIVVTTVKEKGKEIALPKFGGGIGSKDIAVFTRQFSVMIDAGLPLVQCLDILGQQQDNKSFQKVILQVRQDVEGGSSLAEAMRKHPQAFDDLYVNIVVGFRLAGLLHGLSAGRLQLNLHAILFIRIGKLVLNLLERHLTLLTLS